MKVFIVGIAGGVGRLLAERLLATGHEPTGLVRQPKQLEALGARGIRALLGDLTVMTVEELASAIHGSDAIVFSAGAGGRDSDEATTRIDGDGPGKLAKAAKRADVGRFVLVSVFPEAWRERRMDASFEHYMVEKKRAETQLVLTTLDWLIVRPSALTNESGTGTVDLGFAKVHTEVARADVAATIATLLQVPAVNRVIIEVTQGEVPIGDAVDALRVAARP